MPLRVLEAHLQRQLTRGHSHLAAERFTIADLCVASVLNWARAAGDLWGDFPLTSAWLHTCVNRPTLVQLRAQA